MKNVSKYVYQELVTQYNKHQKDFFLKIKEIKKEKVFFNNKKFSILFTIIV